MSSASCKIQTSSCVSDTLKEVGMNLATGISCCAVPISALGNAWEGSRTPPTPSGVAQLLVPSTCKLLGNFRSLVVTFKSFTDVLGYLHHVTLFFCNEEVDGVLCFDSTAHGSVVTTLSEWQ